MSMSRRTKPYLLVLAGTATLGALATPARADRRAFTHTYEYQTMPEGETELEIYSTQDREKFTGDAAKNFELKLEIEHGITERWDFSIYHVFTQRIGVTPEDSEDFRFKEIQLRTRYRFAERGELPVDMLLYAEAVKEFGAGVYEGELKGIFARDFDRLTAVINLIAAVEFGPALDEPELELGWTAGVTYEVIPEWKLGAETWAELPLEEEAGEDAELLAWAGPAISWAPAHSFWISATAGFGLTDEASDIEVRTLLGVHL